MSGVYQAIGAATGAVQAGVVLPAPAAAVESGVDVDWWRGCRGCGQLGLEASLNPGLHTCLHPRIHSCHVCGHSCLYRVPDKCAKRHQTCGGGRCRGRGGRCCHCCWC